MRGEVSVWGPRLRCLFFCLKPEHPVMFTWSGRGYLHKPMKTASYMVVPWHRQALARKISSTPMHSPTSPLRGWTRWRLNAMTKRRDVILKCTWADLSRSCFRINSSVQIQMWKLLIMMITPEMITPFPHANTVFHHLTCTPIWFYNTQISC